MPYIQGWRREQLDRRAGVIAGNIAGSIGELTYVLTKAAVDYLDGVDLTFAEASAVVAAFECAKLEFYRRVLVPYEEQKRALNGDVYGPLAG